ncbi:MAG: outer membrane protein transport protein [Deltaproteobacteria bacterium]|nr:outer membrane protein transport protein [Deltaproteobacteria bacterium]
MKNAIRRIAMPVLAVIATLSWTGRAQAAGFLVYDVSAEGMGKASAFSASIDEPSAIWFNPGAVGFMPGWQASAGGLYVTSSNHFDPKNAGQSWDAKRGNYFLPSAFVTGRILDWFAVGLGVCTPFGLGTKWPANWVGREYALDTSIQTIIINPTLAFKVYKTVSIGVGVDIIYGSVDMKSGLPEVMGGTVEVGGDTWTAGGNIGILWKVLPGLFHASVAYRSRARLNFKNGRADFDPEHEEFDRDLPDQGGKAVIDLPDILTVGFMYRPHPSWTLTLDANVTFWSVYKEIKLDFSEADDVVKHRDWHDAVTVRLGLDYKAPLRSTAGRLNIRAGFLFDQNPAPKDKLDPSLPDANRIAATAGVGYAYKWIKADIGYMFVYFLPSKATTGQEGPEGTYSAMAHLIGLSITGRFGAAARHN